MVRKKQLSFLLLAFATPMLLMVLPAFHRDVLISVGFTRGFLIGACVLMEAVAIAWLVQAAGSAAKLNEDSTGAK